jgi:hypothetical protein
MSRIASGDSDTPNLVGVETMTNANDSHLKRIREIQTYDRVLVCGGRDFRDALSMQDQLRRVMELGAQQSCLPTIINGDAAGADQFADCVAQLLGMPTERYPADWKTHGKSAGPIRNQEMLSTGIDYAVVMPGGRGTEDMVGRLIKSRVGMQVVGK